MAAERGANGLHVVKCVNVHVPCKLASGGGFFSRLRPPTQLCLSSALISFKSKGSQTGQSGDGGSGTWGLLVDLLVTWQIWQEFLAKTVLIAGCRYPEVKAQPRP